MDIEIIQEQVRDRQLRLSIHAEIEAEEESLDISFHTPRQGVRNDS